MGLSGRTYAAHRGVPEAAVRKAIATGRITTLADGTLYSASVRPGGGSGLTFPPVGVAQTAITTGASKPSPDSDRAVAGWR